MELANAHKEKKKEEEKEREKRVREISKQKEDLRRTQLEHTKILLEQLSKAKLDPKERENLMRKVQSVTEDVASSIAKDSSSLATKQQEKAIPMAPIVPAKHSTPKKDWVNKEDKEREMLDRELEMMSQKKADVGSDEAESEASRVERLQKRYDSLQKIVSSLYTLYSSYITYTYITYRLNSTNRVVMLISSIIIESIIIHSHIPLDSRLACV